MIKWTSQLVDTLLGLQQIASAVAYPVESIIDTIGVGEHE